MPKQPIELKEAGGSLNDHVERIARAWRKSRETLPEQKYSYVVDVFPDHAVVTVGNWSDIDRKYYQVNYTATADDVTFGEQWSEVTLAYVAPSGAGADAVDTAGDPPADQAPDAGMTAAADGTDGVVMESIRALVEANSKGQPEAVIVVEGLSLNNHRYTKAALESGIEVFKGAKMYADHPTASEERERPERSVRDLVGKVGEPYVGTDKSGTPALRAPIILSENAAWLKTLIKEGIADGLSIRANGKARKDKASGETIVEAFVADPHTSVDFVTVPAAGGYTQLNESHRAGFWAAVTVEDIHQHRPDLAETLTEGSEPAELVRLRESHQKLLEDHARLFRLVRTQEADVVFGDLLKGLPDPTVAKLREQAKSAVDAYATHGSTQTPEKLKEALSALVMSEKAYLSKVLPHGRVTGLGGQPNPAAESKQILEEAFAGLVPDSSIQVAVQGRN